MTQTYKVQVSMNQAHIVESGIVWKQGDFGFNLEIEVLDFDTTGVTPHIIFRKSAGAVEATSITQSSNKFTYVIRGTELDTPGPCICDLKLYDSTTKRVSTASFKYFVIPDTMDGLEQEASSYSDTIAQILSDYENELYFRDSETFAGLEATEDINFFGYDASNYLVNSAYSGTTGTIVTAGGFAISGYIPIFKGDVVTITIPSTYTAYTKLAIYNSSKTWKSTAASLLTFTATEDGYFRFNYNISQATAGTGTFIKITRRKMIDGYKVENDLYGTVNDAIKAINSNFNKYQISEYYNYADTDLKHKEPHKGYSGTTGTIVDNYTTDITGYIPVKVGDKVTGQIGEYDLFDSTSPGNKKIAFYNTNLQWTSTVSINATPYPSNTITIVADGYIRLMYPNDYSLSININGFKKLNPDMIAENDGKTVDLFIFMGQSNMAGRGTTSTTYPEDAPSVIEGAGWEFRAISDPTKLYAITKTFGYAENTENGINDGTSKTGGLVPSFVNAYYTHNGGTPIIGVSASEGASSITTWIPDGDNLTDALERFDTAVQWLEDNNYTIRHKFMAWCQGEADASQTEEWYTERFIQMFNAMKAVGVEKCFLIRIGNNNPEAQAKINMMSYQNHICQNTEDVIMVSTDFASMLDRGLMKDSEHYYQQGYNEVGTYSGINAAFYVMTGKEPTMYDPQFDNLYYSHKN